MKIKAIDIQIGDLLYEKLEVLKIARFPKPIRFANIPKVAYLIIEYVGEDGFRHANIINAEDDLFVLRKSGVI